MQMTERPTPPTELFETYEERFIPCEDLDAWVRATFLDEGSPLHNPDHAHLEGATIGYLWTNTPNSRNMRHVIGQSELMPPMAMGKWQRARAIAQIEEWFGALPDFLVTLFAPAAITMDDVSFCALVEHELYHCGQERDQYGAPKFTQDGRPKFAIRGHDIEEFVGVIARYGAEAAQVTEMIAAGNAKPLIGRATVEGVCGTCMRIAA